MSTITYRTQGVCARSITVEVDGDVIKDVQFVGGCDGNLKAIGRLVKGRNVGEVRELLEGNTCGNKPTSCADQLAKALSELEA